MINSDSRHENNSQLELSDASNCSENVTYYFKTELYLQESSELAISLFRIFVYFLRHRFFFLPERPAELKCT